MSEKLKRRGGNARKAAAAQGKARKARAVRKSTGSAVDAAMALVPLSDEQLHRVFLVLILGGALALAAVVASQAGVPALANQQVAAVTAGAGFEVRRVEVRGTQHLNELKVYERVLSQRNRAMTQVDLAGLRADLLQLSWVKDARVSRQLPDTLVVDIVERKPHAVLRTADHLMLIDEDGVALDPVSADAAKDMLVLSGPGVAGQVAALSTLLEAAPALKPQVAEAEWVGNRRWNLLFKTGQVLALPEGDRSSADALVSFARLDGTNRLLGGRVTAFDMRAPDRIYLRVPGRSAPATSTPVSAPSAAASTPSATLAAADTAVAAGAIHAVTSHAVTSHAVTSHAVTSHAVTSHATATHAAAIHTAAARVASAHGTARHVAAAHAGLASRAADPVAHIVNHSASKSAGHAAGHSHPAAAGHSASKNASAPHTHSATHVASAIHHPAPASKKVGHSSQSAIHASATHAATHTASHSGPHTVSPNASHTHGHAVVHNAPHTAGHLASHTASHTASRKAN
jgi:cell division protein FtsQ